MFFGGHQTGDSKKPYSWPSGGKDAAGIGGRGLLHPGVWGKKEETVAAGKKKGSNHWRSSRKKRKEKRLNRGQQRERKGGL